MSAATARAQGKQPAVVSRQSTAPTTSPPALSPLAGAISPLDIVDHIATIGAIGVAAYLAVFRAARAETALDAAALAAILKVSREYAAQALRDLVAIGALEFVREGNRRVYQLRRARIGPASAGELREKSGTRVPETGQKSGTIVPDRPSLEPGFQSSGTIVPETAKSGSPVPDFRVRRKEVFLQSSKFKSKSTSPPDTHVLLEGQAPGGAGTGPEPSPSPPSGKARSPDPGSNDPTQKRQPDVRFRLLRNYIPAAYQRRWGHAMPAWGPQHDYALELALGKLAATFDEVLLRQCVDHVLDERGERPPERQDPLKWISILHEFLGGPKDRYGNTIRDEEVTVANATAGRAAVGAFRRNATVARTISNACQTDAALQYLRHQAGDPGGGDAGTASAGQPEQRHGRAGPADRQRSGAG